MSCCRRQEEMGLARKFLLMNGWVECASLKEAHLVIFFTCSFSRSKTVDMLNRLKSVRAVMRSGAELIIGGCLPVTDKKSLEAVFSGRSISPTDFSALDGLPDIKMKMETLQKKINDNEICLDVNCDGRESAGDISPKKPAPGAVKFLARYGPATVLRRIISGRETYFPSRRIGIFVSRGCLRQCSYCAIRFATGPLKSKPPDTIMRKIAEHLKSGYRKFEFYADSIGDYGLDIGTNLGELLDRVLTMDKRFSVGIHDLHPLSFIKYFEKIMALYKSNRVHFLYVALQSGNERILRLMNRSCDVDDLRKKLLKIKKFKKVFLQTSVIVGFPTETEEAFGDTLDLLKHIKFDDAYVHFYTDMPNTESSKLTGKIDKGTLTGRLNKIHGAGIKYDVNESRKELRNLP